MSRCNGKFISIKHAFASLDMFWNEGDNVTVNSFLDTAKQTGAGEYWKTYNSDLTQHLDVLLRKPLFDTWLGIVIYRVS